VRITLAVADRAGSARRQRSAGDGLRGGRGHRTQSAAPTALPRLRSARRSAARRVACQRGRRGHQLFLALYLQQVRGFSPLAASGAFVPFAVALAATVLVAGRVVGGSARGW
jgi:hypothetical protein